MTDTERVDQIRTALAIETHDLSAVALEEVWKAAHQLTVRLTCELWGKQMGWDVPVYGTPEWEELRDAWLSGADEDDASPVTMRKAR